MHKHTFSLLLILALGWLISIPRMDAADMMDLPTADSLQRAGVSDTRYGRFSSAETRLKEALRIRRKLQGRLHPDCAETLQLLADLYTTMGDYAQAEHYANDALNIQKEVSGEESREYASALTTVGRLCLRQNKLKRAELLLRRAKEIYTLRLPGEDTEGFARMAYELSEVLMRKDETLAAMDEADQALRAGRSVFGDKHPFIAGVWARKAEINREAQDVTETVIDDCDRALAIWRETVGEDYLPYIKTLILKGYCVAEHGNIAEAKQLYRRSLDLSRKLFGSSLDYMSEYQREAFWQAIAALSEYHIPAFVSRYIQDDSELASLAYDNELFHKGLLLLSSTELRSAILDSGDTELIARWNELSELKSLLAYERLHYSDKSFRQRELQQRINTLESSLTASASVYRQQMESRTMSFENVRNALPENRVAVEFFTAPMPLPDEDRLYCALLLHARAQQPIFVPLFRESELKAVLTNEAGKMLPPAMLYDVDYQGVKIAKLVWAKLYPYMRQGQIFSFAPCGYLHQLAIEYLPYDATHAMNDVYTLQRISSTRVITQPSKAMKPASAVLFGGIDYSPADKIPALYASLGEVQTIAQQLNGAGCQTRLITGSEASQEALKSLSGQAPNILHIATHGFYLPEAKNRYLLQKSGLIMAGGKSLTAWDIALLDLRQTDMVLLSACETGLGAVSGEGVFGLQRGFKMAGVQTLVMSLWKVDDRATQLLMTTFYRHLILEGKPKHEAFRLAIQAVRTQFETPEYWAAFILLD